VVTETTEGITSATTGQKSGKGIDGSLSGGNVQPGSVYWVELLDWGGLDVGERDRAQIPIPNPTAISITKARMYFLDIFRYAYYSIVTFSPENLCLNSRLSVSNYLSKADLTI
jgi:hypothetical protein